VYVMSLLTIPSFAETCPDKTALGFFKHQIAYERTENSDPLRGLPLIHTDVWIRGPITGFYIHEQLREFNNPTLRMTYLFDDDGLQGGGTCPVVKNWRECIEEFAGAEHASDPITTCKTTIDLRAIPLWRPSPEDQKKKQVAVKLRHEIEARFPGAKEIVVRDFNLKDNQITMYVKMPDGDYFQGCGFHATREPHCVSWHLFGQAPLSSIRKWILERPYRLK